MPGAGWFDKSFVRYRSGNLKDLFIRYIQTRAAYPMLCTPPDVFFVYFFLLCTFLHASFFRHWSYCLVARGFDKPRRSIELWIFLAPLSCCSKYNTYLHLSTINIIYFNLSVVQCYQIKAQNEYYKLVNNTLAVIILKKQHISFAKFSRMQICKMAVSATGAC